MNPSDVLFVAGDVSRLASVKIRCQEIAQRIGSACCYRAASVDEVPSGYKAYFCVKPDFDRSSLTELSRRGAVVWDILDESPPRAGVDVYVTSTQFVKQLFPTLAGQTVVIPHYHCNFERQLGDGRKRVAAYVGSEEWYPKLDGIPHERYFVQRWSRERTAEIYQKIGVALNLRNLGAPCLHPNDQIGPPSPTARHIMLNSGVKLINCLGFGLPSLCSVEPAYLEIAPDCTIFTDQRDCALHLQELSRNDELYGEIRRRCMAAAERYSIDAVAGQYRRLIRGL